MMLAIALMLQAGDVPPAAEEAVANEIVVIGNQIERWKARVRNRNGELVCDIRKSSGDEEIDEIACSAMLGCTLEIKPELDAIAAMDLPRKQRNQMMSEKFAGQEDCIFDRRAAGIEALARKRADEL